MKNYKTTKTKWALLSILVIPAMLFSTLFTTLVHAKEGYGFAVSPMDEKITLTPGDEYSSSVTVINPQEYESDIKYTVEATPYYVDDNYQNIFDDPHGTSNNIVEWIKFTSPTEGRLSPGEKVRIDYTINVPSNAPGGGQYATIMVQADRWSESENNVENNNSKGTISGSLQEIKRIAHIIYAEVTGDIVRRGEITDINVPGFLLSGEIKGTSSIKNTGNVHGDAKYKLQVFPLFSSEEIYTNEENPEKHTILPDRTFYNETVWEQTPGIGIFNVVYTVEFEGVTSQTSKLVIKCPIWLLFIILFVIALIIIWIITRFRHNGKKNRKDTTDANS